jgi:hypothetical protein
MERKTKEVLVVGSHGDNSDMDTDSLKQTRPDYLSTKSGRVSPTKPIAHYRLRANQQ